MSVNITLHDLQKYIEYMTQSTWSLAGDDLIDLCSYSEYEQKVRDLVAHLPVDVDIADDDSGLTFIKIRIRL